MGNNVHHTCFTHQDAKHLGEVAKDAKFVFVLLEQKLQGGSCQDIPSTSKSQHIQKNICIYFYIIYNI